MLSKCSTTKLHPHHKYLDVNVRSENKSRGRMEGLSGEGEEETVGGYKGRETVK